MAGFATSVLAKPQSERKMPKKILDSSTFRSIDARRTPGSRFSPCVALIAISGLLLLLSGCVQRRMIVRTQPEGAFLTIDDKPIGHTPVSVPFTHYGTRELSIEKDGYESIKVDQPVKAPWYLLPPISFFTENFSPKEIRDQHVFDFQLQPKTPGGDGFLLNRANTMRSNVRGGTVTVPAR